MAVAQHLPRGRHQAGDRHLKFHDDRDNLVAVAVGPLGGRPGCSSAAFPGPPAVGCCSLPRRAGSSRCRHATGTCSCRFAAFGIGRALVGGFEGPTECASREPSAVGAGCRPSRGSRRRRAWPRGGSRTGRPVAGRTVRTPRWRSRSRRGRRSSPRRCPCWPARRAGAAHAQADGAYSPSLSEWLRLEDEHYANYLAGTLSFQEQRRARLAGRLAILGSAVPPDIALDRLFELYLRHYEAAWRAYEDVLPVLAGRRADHRGTDEWPGRSATRKAASGRRLGTLHLRSGLLNVAFTQARGCRLRCGV